MLFIGIAVPDHFTIPGFRYWNIGWDSGMQSVIVYFISHYNRSLHISVPINILIYVFELQYGITYNTTFMISTKLTKIDNAQPQHPRLIHISDSYAIAVQQLLHYESYKSHHLIHI